MMSCCRKRRHPSETKEVDRGHSSDSSSSASSDLGRIKSRLWANDEDESGSSGDENDKLVEGNRSCSISHDKPPERKTIDEDERNRRSLDPDYAWDQIRDSQVFLEPPVKNSTKRQPPPSNSVCRLVFISDTHGNHREVAHLPKGDVLVHSGDFTKSGEIGTIEDLALYFSELKGRGLFRSVVCVAGNHDLTLDRNFRSNTSCRYRFSNHAEAAIQKEAIYLRDESHLLEVGRNGDDDAKEYVHFYGSPVTPRFFDWAFNSDRGQAIRDIWKAIPSASDLRVDVLITHGPPLGRGDFVPNHGANGTRAGCYDLLEAIQHTVRPRINVFGHIHEGHGVTYDGKTLYVNASTMNQKYEAVQLPIVVDLSTNDTSAPPQWVLPSSLLHNATTHIGSIADWIEWCYHHGHQEVAAVLLEAQNSTHNPRKDELENWFPKHGDTNNDEPPALEFFESLFDVLLGYYIQQQQKEGRRFKAIKRFRRQLAAMVFHLYAMAF